MTLAKKNLSDKKQEGSGKRGEMPRSSDVPRPNRDDK